MSLLKELSKHNSVSLLIYYYFLNTNLRCKRGREKHFTSHSLVYPRRQITTRARAGLSQTRAGNVTQVSQVLSRTQWLESSLLPPHLWAKKVEPGLKPRDSWCGMLDALNAISNTLSLLHKISLTSNTTLPGCFPVPMMKGTCLYTTCLYITSCTYFKIPCTFMTS